MAEWVSASIYLKSGSNLAEVILSTIIDWQLGVGGNILLDCTADSLQIYPKLSESMCVMLGMKTDEILFFDLEVKNGDDIFLELGKSVTMIRQIANRIVRKKRISLDFILEGARSKSVLYISTL